MESLSGLIAYPARPAAVADVVKAALATLNKRPRTRQLGSWEEVDVPGRFLTTTILERIDAGNVFIADITHFNFNVVFEIGYAVGAQKRVILTLNDSLDNSRELIRAVGIFDTIGYATYTNSPEFVSAVEKVQDLAPLRSTALEPNKGTPVYLLLPRLKTDSEIRITSRIKKARLRFRTFDPEELGRLPANEAIDGVAQSLGIITVLLPSRRRDADEHNFRAAFVAGLCVALDKALLLLQDGDEPVPLDYRDLVHTFFFPDQIDEHIANFSPEVTAALQSVSPTVIRERATFLERLTLGASSAENEYDQLGHYYLETDEFQRAARGEVRIVAGRKGSGKSALFFQLRDRLRRHPHNVVLDLKPEGFQLLKFRDRVLNYLEEGAREHTITAFWEYLVLLEVCNKLLQADEARHMRDSRLYERYRALGERYFTDEYIGEGDFSERMLKLTSRIADDFDAYKFDSGRSSLVTTGEITEVLYKHDVAGLRDLVVDYLQFKKSLWILFDNLDKGWPAHGVGTEDVRTIRALIEAMRKLEQRISREGVECHGIVFIRNDVYELLVSASPDRGKVAAVSLDWTDPDLLRELLRRRFQHGGDVDAEANFGDVWREICTTHIRGEETSQYMIERCLMRPRALIEFLRFCRSHAVNLGHRRIEVDDIEHGEEAYAAELLNNLNYEIRDVLGNGTDVLYEFVESPSELGSDVVLENVARVVGTQQAETVVDLLLWFGFLGVKRNHEAATYIYDVKYDQKRLRALTTRRQEEGGLVYEINPAFWQALEVDDVG